MKWAPAAGFEADVISQFDLQLRPESIEGYPCLVFIGHDEYWSWEMRDTVDAYVEGSGRIARFAWLLRRDPQVERVTTNVLSRFLSR